MVVPTFGAPGYGAQYAQLQAANDQTQGGMIEAQLGMYSDVIRGLMQNAEKVANVSGSGALDKIAGAYAGAREPLFGGDYAGAMDRLRQQALTADIGATNRRGTGGGGSGKPPKYGGPGSDEMVISIDGGAPLVIDAGDLETHQFNANSQGQKLTVLQAGRPADTYNGYQAPAVPGAPPTPDVPGVPSVTETQLPASAPKVTQSPTGGWQVDPANGKRYLEYDGTRIYEDGT